MITSFDPAADLIRVPTTIWNARGQSRKLWLALDTGSSETMVTPDVTDALGYGARGGLKRTVIRSAIGDEPGYLMKVARLEALGFAIDDFTMHIHDLPDGHDIDGLLGLSFQRHFDYTVRSRRGTSILKSLIPNLLILLLDTAL